MIICVALIARAVGLLPPRLMETHFVGGAPTSKRWVARSMNPELVA